MARGLKANGTLKKGYRFARGGRVVKAKTGATHHHKKKSHRRTGGTALDKLATKVAAKVAAKLKRRRR